MDDSWISQRISEIELSLAAMNQELMCVTQNHKEIELKFKINQLNDELKNYRIYIKNCSMASLHVADQNKIL